MARGCRHDVAHARRRRSLSDAIRADMPQLMTLYRDLHANPELSMQEVRTPAKLAPEMRKLGFDVTEHVGKTGVVAVMKNGPGPVLLIRADMDALPVKEQTGLPFASKVVGKLPRRHRTPVMHACGHDTHIATWLGTARRLAAMKDQWSGTLVMVLQPGEELVEGAKAMLDDGLFTRFPKPDYLLAFHDSASLPAGVIGVTPGYALANVDTRQHRREGRRRARRLSRNDQGPDRPRVAHRHRAANLGQPRERPASSRPSSPSAASMPGPRTTSFPTRPSSALTVRSYTPEARKLLLDGIARIARGEAIAAGLPEDRMPVVKIEQPSADRPSTPSPSSDRLTDAVRRRTSERIG